MKKTRNLLILICALLPLSVMAEENERKIATVDLTSESSLAEVLGDDLLEIDSLVVKGTFAADNIPALRQAVSEGKLRGINMKECNFASNAIPAEMLYGVKKLSYFTFPQNVEKIGAWAFAYCGALRELVFPATVNEIGHGAFCQALAAAGVSKYPVTIPTAVKVIPPRCFEAASITELNLPEGLEEIGDSALMFVQFMKSVNLPASLKRIGDYAMASMMSMESIEVPEDTELGEYVFYNNLNLERAVLKGTHSEIPEGTFDTCRKLTSVQMPDGVEAIGVNAFCRTSISKMTLPDGLKEIGENAFNDTQLTSIEIPASVQIVGKGAFSSSKKLRSAHFNGDIETLVATFNGCAKLETVNLPDGLREIGENTFLDCSMLTGEVEVPDGVTTIGSNAFCRTAYTAVTLPASVSEIGYSAFREVPITKINLPEALSKIEDGTFAKTKLTAVDIPKSVTSVGDNAFEDDPITELSLKEGLTTIGEAAFSGCLLTTLDLPSTMSKIGFHAFRGCPLTRVSCRSVTAPAITGHASSGYTDEYTPFTTATTATLVVPRNTKDLYQAALYWKRFGTILESDFVDSVEDIRTVTPGSGVIYDIHGRQVSEMQPGQVYIRDGKKVIVR